MRLSDKWGHSFQSLSQQRMNRDNDWIWLGRDALVESQHDASVSNQTGSRLATATTSIDLSKNPTLSRTPLTPTVPLASSSPAFDDKSRLGAVTIPQQQKMSLTSSFPGGNPRMPLSQKNTLSTCATCHYEVSQHIIKPLYLTEFGRCCTLQCLKI